MTPRLPERPVSRNSPRLSRRGFLKAGAAASVAALAMTAPRAYAAGADVVRAALIGCGRRGSGAAKDCVLSSPNVEIVALADIFKDKLNGCRGELAGLGEKFKVTDETCFVGFDACEKVCALKDVDLVLLCAPPGFRPLHLKAAVEAGKHVFMEKPAGVDPAGIRSVLKSAELAAQKKLGIVAGTQRRHDAGYVEIMKRVHDGVIGDLVAGGAYWMGDYSYYQAVLKKPEWSDMEWQLRNWNYFTWLSGDHVVEQHVHNIDIMNWALKSPPVKCIATGGRQQRTAPEFGHIFDHFAIEFEYPGGVRVTSLSRQQANVSHRVSEFLAGTKGKSDASRSIWGETNFKYEGKVNNPYVQEHADLIAGIRGGNPLNEGQAVAESTLAAIMGRMAAYTGREINWQWVLNASKLDLAPPKYEFGPLPVPPVAIPGQAELV